MESHFLSRQAEQESSAQTNESRLMRSSLARPEHVCKAGLQDIAVLFFLPVRKSI
jgi:hypothetical protein